MVENSSSVTDHFQFSSHAAINENAKKICKIGVVFDFLFASSHQTGLNA